MGPRLRRSRSISAPEYLPPLELLPDIEIKGNSYSSKDRFDVPLDDNKIPQPIQLLKQLGSRIIYSADYEAYALRMLSDPKRRIANVDHLAHPRPVYERFGLTSFQNKHREGSGIKIEMFIPIHNLRHFVTNDPLVPEDEIMRARAYEQDEVKYLFRMSSAALWLDSMEDQGLQTYRTAEEYLLRKGYRGDGLGNRGLPSRTTVLDRLDRIKPGTMGILPDFEELSKLSLPDIVSTLAIWGAYDTVMTAEESTAIIMEASREASGYRLAA